MRPQAWLLPMEPQIRLPYRVGTHLLPNLLIFPIIIYDRTVGDGVHHMDAFFAHLSGERLRQLSDSGATSSIGGELGGASKGTEGSGEDERLERSQRVIWQRKIGR